MDRLARMHERRGDVAQYVRAATNHDIFQKVSSSAAVKYVLATMAPIDGNYTKNTFAQGDRVKEQLDKGLTERCDFEYQGSVSTDTHIKQYSDIDLLVLLKKFSWIEPPQFVSNPYLGSPKDDILALRASAYSRLKIAFPEALVDNSGATAVAISGGSLKRDVDVVPATWFHTNAYATSNDSAYRGVKVFNKALQEFVSNTPFLHKRRIEIRDQECRGGLRKAIRLLKSIKADSEGRVELSSYNIAGIAYSIPAAQLLVPGQRELSILEACYAQCEMLAGNATLREQIKVPDESRPVFGSTFGANNEQLAALTKELWDLRSQIAMETASSLARIQETEVPFRVTYLVT